MTKINSVLGPIDSAKLGTTLMHEHVITASSSPALIENYPELFPDNFMDTLVVPGLTEAKKDGIDTIVDCTTLDLGRNVKLMVEASRRSGVNIIACTGWWYNIPSRIWDSIPVDLFAELWIHDIQKGMADTGVKAGILKGASDFMGVTPVEEKILRSVARAHKHTGVPICVHSCSPLQVGRRQVEILKEEGVDLGRVKIDHSNDTTDVEYLVSLLKQGVWLGMDRYPGRSPPSASVLARNKTLKALIDAGYANRLLVSHDGGVGAWIKTFSPVEVKRKLNPYGFLYLQKVVFPQLREWGVTEVVLKSLLVDNPRHFFEGDLH